MISCKVCKFCDTQYANTGYGYCKLKLPVWMTVDSNTAFGVDKMVCIKLHCDDGCDLGVVLANGETAEFPPTEAGYL